MTESDLLFNLSILAGVVAGALLIHIALFRVLFRFGWRTEAAVRFRQRLKWPARTTTALVAMLVSLPVARLDPEARGVVRHLLFVGVILAVAWLLTRGIRVVEENLVTDIDLSRRDNLLARRRLTQVVVLRRVATILVFVLAAAAILLTFEEGRSLGASVLASAGLVGLVAGIAGRTTLANIVAGLQIVLAEPIRLEDVVVVEEEWGHIEEITLTYVVVRLWDRRRLVLPTVYFVEQPFQNWTRQRAQVIGSVSLFLDYRAPIDALRVVLDEALRASDRWDGDVSVLQVIDATEHTIHVRALMSAEDAPTAWDLRCEVREHLVRWLCDHHPASLPVQRVELPDTDDTDRAEPRIGPARRSDAHLEEALGPAGPTEERQRSGGG